MKKIIGTFIFALLLLPMMVNATASDFSWEAGDKHLSFNDKYSKEDTAYLNWAGGSYVLYLMNYNGKELKMGGHTSDNANYIIVLEGENTITSDSIGITTNTSHEGNPTKIQFVGNGTLTINAPTPISYEDYKDSVVINPSKNEVTVVTKQIVEQSEAEKTEEVTTQEEETTKETKEITEEKKEETSTKKENTIDYKLFFIISLIVAVLLLGTTIFLIIKLKKKK